MVKGSNPSHWTQQSKGQKRFLQIPILAIIIHHRPESETITRKQKTFILWKDADDVAFCEVIGETTNEDPGAVFVLIMPGLLANDTQLQLPLVQFLDILYISATKPEDLTFLQQSQKILHFCNKARRSYISATKPEGHGFDPWHGQWSSWWNFFSS